RLGVLLLVALAAEATLAHEPFVPGTYGDAMRWYRKAAGWGDAGAQFFLGYKYETGEGVRRDLSLAREWYWKAAVQGHLAAQFRLAFLYYRGEGGEADIDEAVRWYLEAAERGHVPAQSMLGYLYTGVDALPENIPEAFFWLSLAARAGDEDAAANAELVAKALSDEALSAAHERLRVWRPQPAPTQAPDG
ncbi:MAG: tetratricopeptide repeat protein, partial [Alphaproteobacteria bacterium]